MANSGVRAIRLSLISVLLVPIAGFCQSVYSLEVLPSGHFQPGEKYTAITGLHIDPDGNIAGVASKEIAGGKTKTTGFLWRPGANPVLALVWGEGKSTTGCTPRGFDADGNVYLYCGAVAPNILFSPGTKSYREAQLREPSTVTLGSAGSWSAGAYTVNNVVRAVRAESGNPPQTLVPANAHRDSSAFAIDSRGQAVGISGVLADLPDRGGASVASGVAVFWPEGKQEPRLIIGPPNSTWTPWLARAISERGIIAGSTSPAFASAEACPGGQSAPQITGSFVAQIGNDGPVAQSLPSVPGDPANTSNTPMAINTVPQIVGYREAFECIDGTLVKDRRAVRWREEKNSWVAEIIDRLPVSLTAVCSRDLVLIEANSTNESGQLTGSGACISQDDERITFAYRLTPIGPEELPLR